jgi:glycosyltransferase involved in cell wall biosynthesis
VHQLSAVIITHNEERNIARCIASLKGMADEVVVVDSHSTDATQRICEEMGAKVLTRDWDGYSPQRNFAMDAASSDWILAIDADEELSPQLRDSILKVKAEGGHMNFTFNRRTNYCGQWINHSGWYPDTKFRLFDRRECRWQGIVHETLTVPISGIRHLKGDLLHYSYSTITEHIDRTDRYATLAAQELLAQGKSTSLLKQIFSPVLKFIKFYVIGMGFLDGWHGLVIAWVSANGTYLKYERHRQLARP